MFERTRALYDDLATTLGVAALPADASGSVQLSVGENSTVALFAEDEFTLLLASPVTELPRQVDYGGFSGCCAATSTIARSRRSASPAIPRATSSSGAGCRSRA